MEPGLQLRAEGNKLLHDTMKQLITISSGSILIVFTFWEKSFPRHLWKASVAVAFMSFLTCIMAALYMMKTISEKMATGYAEESEEELQKKEDRVFLTAAGAFLIAILALVVFVIETCFLVSNPRFALR